jgi:hypothetical protein
LDDFAVISGLKCNFDKTNVMQVGPPVAIGPEFTDLGFNYTEELSLLGFRLNKNGLMIDEMFQEVTEKIVRLITIWERYRLSFPGRINVCKSLLLSQVSYIGSIVMPNDDTLIRLQNLLNTFALGNIRMARERLYIPPSEGRAGLINLKNFLTGQQATWIQRAHLSTKDVWRVTFRDLSSGNCYTINEKFICRNRHPVLANIATSFVHFRDLFYNKNDNFRSAFILSNNLITRGINTRGILDPEFLNGCGIRNPEQVLSKLVVKDLFSNNTLKFHADIARETGLTH